MTPETLDAQIVCPRCQQQIDPEVCWCGDLMSTHSHHSGHSAVPMGCECGRQPIEDTPPFEQRIYGNPKSALSLPTLKKQIAVLNTDGPRIREPDCCANCVRWEGKDGQTFGRCSLLLMETADSSTCEAFQAKANINEKD